jgi:hypothetical protein
MRAREQKPVIEAGSTRSAGVTRARWRSGALRLTAWTAGRLRAAGLERGAATAEYAIAMLGAVGFAGVLVLILRGDEVRQILTDPVRGALTSAP